MLKETIMLILLSVGLVGPAFTATTPKTPTEAAPATDKATELSREAILANKKAIIANNLKMDQKEEKAFWPLYEEYQIGLNKQNMELNNLINKFAINYNNQNISDDLAKELVDSYIKIEKDKLDYRQDWMNKFRKSISQKTVARFFQIENKLESMVRYEASRQIPLVN